MIENLILNNFEEEKNNLRKIRNDIVGSVENKMEFMKNNSLKEYILYYLMIFKN